MPRGTLWGVLLPLCRKGAARRQLPPQAICGRGLFRVGWCPATSIFDFFQAGRMQYACRQWPCRVARPVMCAGDAGGGGDTDFRALGAQPAGDPGLAGREMARNGTTGLFSGKATGAGAGAGCSCRRRSSIRQRRCPRRGWTRTVLGRTARPWHTHASGGGVSACCCGRGGWRSPGWHQFAFLSVRGVVPAIGAPATLLQALK
jgi:hypothetical protein